MKKLNCLVLDPENSFKDIVFFESNMVEVLYDGQVFYKKDPSFFKQFDMVLCVHAGNPLNLYILSKCYGVCLTVLVADGVYEWDNAYRNPKTVKVGVSLYDPVLVDVFLHTGHCVNYLKYINPKSVFLSYLPYRMRNVKHEGMRMNVPQLVKNRCKKLLVTSARTPYFDVDERKRLVEIYREIIIDALAVFDVIEFRVFDDNFLVEITKDLGAFRNIKDGSFEAVVSEYDAVVTTTSSISLEVMKRDIPLAHVDVRDSPLFVQAGWRITGSVNVVSVLKSMATRDPSRMSYQRSQIKQLEAPEVVEVADLLDRFDPIKLDPSVVKDLYASLVLQSRWNINLKVIVKRFFTFLK